MTVKLIVVDDHAIVRRGIVQVLSEHPDVQIVAEAVGDVRIAQELDVLLRGRLVVERRLHPARALRQQVEGITFAGRDQVALGEVPQARAPQRDVRVRGPEGRHPRQRNDVVRERRASIVADVVVGVGLLGKIGGGEGVEVAVEAAFRSRLRHLARHRLHVAHGRQVPAHAVLHHLGQAPDAARNDWNAARHGLQQRNSKPLIKRWHHKKPGLTIKPSKRSFINERLEARAMPDARRVSDPSRGWWRPRSAAGRRPRARG